MYRFAEEAGVPTIAIRCGKGLGDALYLQSVVRYFVGKGYHVEACCNFPDVFRPLKDSVTVSPFRRNRIDKSAHYSNRKTILATDMFEDCCINAGITESVEMKLDWVPQNLELIGQIKTGANGRPIIAIQLPRSPMDRIDGYGLELLPDCRVIQQAIDLIGDRALTVQVGAGKPLFEFSGIGLDLANRTSVSDVIDIAHTVQGFLGYCSFFVPLAESFSKPVLFVWSSAGLKSQNAFIRTVSPQKVLHRESSRYVIDDCSQGELSDAVNKLFEQIGGQTKV